MMVVLPCAHCWDTEELEMFDLVEEVNQNFYEVMGVGQVGKMMKVWGSVQYSSLYSLFSIVLQDGPVRDKRIILMHDNFPFISFSLMQKLNPPNLI